ncbi:MAG: tryptophan-rich sensory protein [Gordonibacter pamelaeae]
MWIVYALTLVGNAVIEGGRWEATTSATVAYGVYTWFTPAGYVFSIWSLIYVALIGWLVAYTREAPSRAKRFTPVSVLFIGSCVLNVLWLALWHFELVGISFIVILAEWAVLAALYLNVRRSAKSGWGWVPISIYTAWVTVAALANMAILVTRALDGGIAFFNGLSVVVLTAGVLALGYVMRTTYDDVAFPLVFLWALIGVGVHVAEVSLFTVSIVFILSSWARCSRSCRWASCGPRCAGRRFAGRRGLASGRPLAGACEARGRRRRCRLPARPGCAGLPRPGRFRIMALMRSVC